MPRLSWTKSKERPKGGAGNPVHYTVIRGNVDCLALWCVPCTVFGCAHPAQHQCANIILQCFEIEDKRGMKKGLRGSALPEAPADSATTPNLAGVCGSGVAQRPGLLDRLDQRERRGATPSLR